MALIWSTIAAIATFSSHSFVAPLTVPKGGASPGRTGGDTPEIASPLSFPSPSVAKCQAKILPYSSLRHLNGPVRSLQVEGTGTGSLYYVGVTHTNAPQHPQFDQIEEDFYRIQPTIVFYEGPERSLPTTRNSAIEKAGDPGLIRYLATQQQIPIAPLEPSRQAEINILLERFTPEQIKLFYVLRQVTELRERWGTTSKAQLQQAVVRSINQFSGFDGLKTVITDMDDFETSYQKHWQSSTNWWQVPQQWFHPVLTVEETGGIFTNDIHRTASTFRNQHMAQVIADAVNQGHRVMATVGHSHLPLQAPALECLIQ